MAFGRRGSVARRPARRRSSCYGENFEVTLDDFEVSLDDFFRDVAPPSPAADDSKTKKKRDGGGGGRGGRRRRSSVFGRIIKKSGSGDDDGDGERRPSFKPNAGRRLSSVFGRRTSSISSAHLDGSNHSISSFLGRRLSSRAPAKPDASAKGGGSGHSRRGCAGRRSSLRRTSLSVPERDLLRALEKKKVEKKSGDAAADAPATVAEEKKSEDHQVKEQDAGNSEGGGEEERRGGFGGGGCRRRSRYRTSIRASVRRGSLKGMLTSEEVEFLNALADAASGDEKEDDDDDDEGKRSSWEVTTEALAGAARTLRNPMFGGMGDDDDTDHDSDGDEEEADREELERRPETEALETVPEPKLCSSTEDGETEDDPEPLETVTEPELCSSAEEEGETKNDKSESALADADELLTILSNDQDKDKEEEEKDDNDKEESPEKRREERVGEDPPQKDEEVPPPIPSSRSSMSRDSFYRRELWKTKQRSTIRDGSEDEDDEDAESQADDNFVVKGRPSFQRSSSLFSNLFKTDDGSAEQRRPSFRRSSSMFTSLYKTLENFAPDDSSPYQCTPGDYGEYNDEDSLGTFSSHGDSDEGKGADQMWIPAEVPFSILGAPAPAQLSSSLSSLGKDGFDCVLTPPLMDTLRMKLPRALRGDNYWLKYSLVRDGASIETLLSKVRSSSHCVLAVETSDGNVLGSFTSTPWRKSTAGDTTGGRYFGSCEAFLWRLAASRDGDEALHESDVALGDMGRRAQLESDVEVFPWSGSNRCVQMSDGRSILAVGGGEPDEDVDRRVRDAAAGTVNDKDAGGTSSSPRREWDFGLVLNGDLSRGSTGRCATFGTTALGLLSPHSPTNSSDGGAEDERESSAPPFEVTNVEVWTLTPMFDVERAEKLEMGRKFVLSSVMSKAKTSIKRRL